MKVVKTMDKVWCPYCGAEMEMMDKGDWAYMKCPNLDCEAEGPLRGTVDAAYAAMQRWQEPLKPMTLDEATGDNEPCVFLEIKDNEPIWACDCVISSNFKGVHISFIGDSGRTLVAIPDYCKTWRCWLRRPTDEERKAARWEDD